jgi:hypothetical protein
MGEKARLILQGRIYDEVRVESGDSQERTGKIAKKACFEFLVDEESRDSETFLIGFQDFLGVVHFFFRYP